MITRIKDGIAAARKRGVKLGAPRKITEEVVANVKQLRQSGCKFREISRRLNMPLSSVHRAVNG